MPGSITPMQPGVAPPTAGGGAGQPGLLSRIFENNQGKWLIGLGVATLIVMIFYARRQSSQSTVTDTGSVASTTPTSPDQMWGSQLETDYQQMIANQNTTTGLLQAIQNQLSNTTPTPPAPTPTPTPVRQWGPPPSNPLQAWIPKSSDPNFLSNVWAGKQFEYEGIWTTLVPGPAGSGRIWEVPGKVSAQQAINTPVGPGQKQLLYQR